MAKVQLGAAAAIAVLSFAILSAQTTGQGRTPDRPLPNSDAARQAQMMTISGCVVRDAATGGGPTIASNGISYKLTGKRDSELASYLGKRIEVTGRLDSGSTGARATSGKTGDILAPVMPRDNNAVPLATDKGTTADVTGRLQVKTIKLVAPSCL
jgi:hypothetical protein